VRKPGISSVYLAAFLAITLAIALAPAPKHLATQTEQQVARSGLDAYRGLGSWIDVFDQKSFSNPAATMAAMRQRGVRTVFLETGNYGLKQPIYDPKAVAAFIDAAHQQGMSIVAWYLPGLQNMTQDFVASMAAINFRTPDGQGFDSFGLDIEATLVKSPSVRSTRLLQLSAQIRAAVGTGYPLGAIIPSPLGIALAKKFWPGFPYRGLAQIYDVFLPMSYFTWAGNGADQAHSYISRSVALIREGTGDPTVPIHVIGGLANQMTVAETQAFVQAVRENGALGASVYDWKIMHASNWPALQQIPVNPPQTPALPLSLPYAPPIGNVPGADTTHPKEVFFRDAPSGGSATLSFDAYDIQQGEVSIWVNWRSLLYLAPTHANAWGQRQTVTIPASMLSTTGSNLIAFTATGDYPAWSVWGVRNVSVEQPPAPSPSPTPVPSPTGSPTSSPTSARNSPSP
jgi:hypothetical protein